MENKGKKISKKVYWGFYIDKELKDMAVEVAKGNYKNNSEFLEDAVFEIVRAWDKYTPIF